MKTQNLVLEISESLFQQLEYLSKLADESINNLAIQLIADKIIDATRKAEELDRLLDQISEDNLPETVDDGSPVGVENLTFNP